MRIHLTRFALLAISSNLENRIESTVEQDLLDCIELSLLLWAVSILKRRISSKLTMLPCGKPLTTTEEKAKCFWRIVSTLLQETLNQSATNGESRSNLFGFRGALGKQTEL